MMTMTANPTNREKLLEELGALDSIDLYMAFADNHLTRTIDDAMCVDCKAKHGRCVSISDDTPCPIPLDDWMDQPNTGKRILPPT